MGLHEDSRCSVWFPGICCVAISVFWMAARVLLCGCKVVLCGCQAIATQF